MESFLTLLLIPLIAVAGVYVIRRPYVGVVLTAASLPVVDVLPPFPMATSVVSFLGGLTVVSYLLQTIAGNKTFLRRLTIGHYASILFVLWTIVSAPLGALGPNREWIWSLVQLVVVAWVASALLVSPGEHRALMWAFSISTLVSAIFAIQQGGFAEELKYSVRGHGLAGGANSAARYIVVALAFLIYLSDSTRKRWVRLFAFGAIGIVLLGVVYTVSRTGVMLALVVIGGALLRRTSDKLRNTIAVAMVIAVVAFIFIPQQFFGVVQSILPSIQSGTDTIGQRYELWQAGLNMWLDNVFTGVGIGQFSNSLRFYAPEDLPLRDYRLGAHNMYVQVLAETGIVGFLLFLTMLMSGVRALWRAVRLPNRSISALAWAWLLAFTVMLLGGLTKHDQYDKLLWITIGVSCYFDRLARTVLVKVFPINAASPTSLPPGRRLRGNERYEKQVRRA